MDDNRYSPPLARVDDTAGEAEAPALWNPNAAANWSLLFSPAFGAWLHMRNWQALGEPGKAARSRTWMIAALALLGLWLVLAVVSPDSAFARGGGDRAVGFVLLLAWYFGSAREQARLVRGRFGDRYPRRGWGRPLLVAVGLVLGYFAVAVVLGFASASVRE